MVTCSFPYDPSGRETGRRYPDGSRVTTVYDPSGNRLLVADNTGRYTRTFDPLNQTLTSTNAVDLTLTFTYDPLGRRSTLTDANGGVTTTSYDPAGRTAGLTSLSRSDRAAAERAINDLKDAIRIAEGR